MVQFRSSKRAYRPAGARPPPSPRLRRSGAASLEADGVALTEPLARALCGAPAGDALECLGVLALVEGAGGIRAGVQPEPRDHREGMAGVGEDRDPLAVTALAEAEERARVERALEQSAVDQRVRDGAGAVVAVVLDLGVPAAVLVRHVLDLVGGPDRLLDLDRRVSGRGRGAVGHELGRC